MVQQADERPPVHLESQVWVFPGESQAPPSCFRVSSTLRCREAWLSPHPLPPLLSAPQSWLLFLLGTAGLGCLLPWQLGMASQQSVRRCAVSPFEAGPRITFCALASRFSPSAGSLHSTWRLDSKFLPSPSSFQNKLHKQPVPEGYIFNTPQIPP